MALLFMLSRYVRHAGESDPSFDGAMNLNVARSLAEGRGYGFRYDSFFAFPAQTDGPFVLPAAALFRLFGVGVFTAQATSLLYLAGFALLVVVVVRRVGAPVWLATIGATLCLLTPGVGTYGMDGYGEIPMLFWMLAGLLAGLRALDGGWARGWLFATGVLLGLSVLTKMVAVLCAGPVLLCVGVAVLGRSRGRAGLGGLAWLGAGCLVPVVGWELFRLVCLGGAAGWVGWWRLQLAQVGEQSGGGGGFALSGLIARVRLHGASLAGQSGIPPALLPAWLLLPWGMAVVVAADRRRPVALRVCVAVLGLGALLHVVWWLGVMPDRTLWLRRVLAGLLLQTCLIGVLLADLLARAPAWGRGRGLVGVLAGLVAAGEVALLVCGAGQSPPVDWAFRRAETGQAVGLLRALPADAVVFGVGWWQAPKLALLADRWFMNIDLWSPERLDSLRHAYFVTDAAATYIAPDRIRDVLLHTRHVTLMQGREVALYRILSADPDRGLREAPVSARFDAATDAMAPGSGWYASVGGQAWVRPDSRIRLLRSDETRLVLEATFDPGLFRPGDPVRHLHVVLPGCLDRVLPIEAAGRRTIALPLSCAAGAPGAVIVTLSLDARMPSVHQLDSDTRLRGFAIRSLFLEH